MTTKPAKGSQRFWTSPWMSPFLINALLYLEYIDISYRYGNGKMSISLKQFLHDSLILNFAIHLKNVLS